jgi:hypothetical protein
MNRRPRPLKPFPTNSRKVNGASKVAARAVLDAQSDPAKRAAACHRADAPNTGEPQLSHEGRHLVTIIDAHDGRPGHLDRDADLTAMIAWLRWQLAAQRAAPRPRGRPTDYAGLLSMALSIAAAAVPFSTARGSLCEQVVIRTRLVELGCNADDGARLAEWAHDKLRQLASIPRVDSSPATDTGMPGWKPPPEWASDRAEAENEQLEALYDGLYPSWRRG